MSAPAVDPAVLAAWQAAFAAEHEAIFGYALLGPRLAGAERASASRCEAAHEVVRAAVESALTAIGAAPATPLPDYPQLYPVADATAARRLAIRLEDGCAAAWRYLYLRAASAPSTSTSAPTSGLRVTAQAQLTASAITGSRWRALVSPGAAPVAFPGI